MTKEETKTIDRKSTEKPTRKADTEKQEENTINTGIRNVISLRRTETKLLLENKELEIDDRGITETKCKEPGMKCSPEQTFYGARSGSD